MAAAKPHILIAGGGIGGMCAAAALLQRGFDVDVFEQAEAQREIGAGIQISPNGCRALDSIGAFEPLRKLSCRAESKEVRLWNSGKAWKLFDLGAQAVERYGYPYLTVYRPDLLEAVSAAALRLKPSALHLGSKAAGFAESGGKVHLTLENGATVTGDALIGSDGVHSMTRRLTADDAPPVYPGMMIWRAVIPARDLPERLRAGMAVNWIGPNGHVVHYPLRGGEWINLAATLERREWDEPGGWMAEGAKRQCHEDYSGWHEDAHALIDAAPKLIKWAYLTRAPLARWAYGRAALLGDACHPTLPFLAQGAVIALEDGIVLARCFETYSDAPEALRAYERARLERGNRMVAESSAMAAHFHNPGYRDAGWAEAYIDREWSADAIAARYDWLFTYNCDSADI